MDERMVGFLSKLKPADILLTANHGFDPISQFIRWYSGSKVSHGTLYSGSGFITESIFTGVRKVHWTQSGYDKKHYVVAMRYKNLSDDIAAKIVENAEKEVGHLYDYPMLAAITLLMGLQKLGFDTRKMRNKLDTKAYFICTELIVDKYYECGGIQLVNDVNRSQVSPADLLNSPSLEIVAELQP